MELLKGVLQILVFAVGTLCFLFSYKYLRKKIALSYVRKGAVVENDDDIAIDCSIALAKEAKRDIEMFDDGDLDESFKSLYNDERFIETLRSKLEENPEFKVKAFFNIGDPSLRFIQAFREDDRVEIYKLKAGLSRWSLHYRLIDGGTKGILAEHPQGVGDRTYQELSIPNRSKRDTAVAGRFVLEKYRQPEENFERLEVVQ